MIFILPIICFIFSIIFVIFRAKETSFKVLILKTISSLLIVISGLIIGFIKEFSILNLLLVIGMTLGLLGDVFLDLKYLYVEHRNKYLILGFIFFGLGHFAYLAEMIIYTKSWFFVFSIIPAIIAVISVFIIAKLIKVNFEGTKGIAFTYCLILANMFFSGILAFILNNSMWPMLVGFTLFTISDGILSLMYYAGFDNNKLFNIISHTTYYLAQIFIAFSILFI